MVPLELGSFVYCSESVCCCMPIFRSTVQPGPDKNYSRPQRSSVVLMDWMRFICLFLSMLRISIKKLMETIAIRLHWKGQGFFPLWTNQLLSFHLMSFRSFLQATIKVYTSGMLSFVGIDGDNAWHFVFWSFPTVWMLSFQNMWVSCHQVLLAVVLQSSSPYGNEALDSTN